jgi:regulatory protein
VKAPRSLKGRALAWLAQREQSRSELRRKLLRCALLEDKAAALSAAGGADEFEAFGTPEPRAASAAPAAERVEDLLNWLAAHNFLCEERFVESRVHARAARFGNLRIRQELKQHQLQVPPEIAASLRETELQRARAVRERKFEHWPHDAASRARQARYLAGRGFSPEAIGRALRADPPGTEHNAVERSANRANDGDTEND